MKANNYEIYVSKYLLFGKKTRAVSGNMRQMFYKPNKIFFWNFGKFLIPHKSCHQKDNFEKQNLEKKLSKKFANEIRKKRLSKKIENQFFFQKNIKEWSS